MQNKKEEKIILLFLALAFALAFSTCVPYLLVITFALAFYQHLADQGLICERTCVINIS